MRLILSLLTSLLLHAAFLAGLGWIHAAMRAKNPQRLEIRLPPKPVKTDDAQQTPAAVEKAAKHDEPADEPQMPKKLRGAALKRAQKAIAEHIFYPPAAIKQGLEGEVVLLLRLDATGVVEHSEIARSSGHAVLDNAALEAVRSLGALPGNPRQTLLPVRFVLQ